MDALPEDWQAVPNEKEKCEEITRLTVDTHLIRIRISSLHWSICTGPITQSLTVWLRPSKCRYEVLYDCRFLKTSVILTEPPHFCRVVIHSSKRALLIGDTYKRITLTLHIWVYQRWCRLQLPSSGASKRQSCLSCSWKPSVCFVANIRAFTQGMRADERIKTHHHALCALNDAKVDDYYRFLPLRL